MKLIMFLVRVVSKLLNWPVLSLEPGFLVEILTWVHLVVMLPERFTTEFRMAIKRLLESPKV